MASGAGNKKKGAGRNQSSTPASDYGGESGSKSLSERRADKYQAKQQVQQPKPKEQQPKQPQIVGSASKNAEDKMIVATLTKNQGEPQS